MFLQSCRKNDLSPTVQPAASNYSSKVAVEWMSAIRKVVQSEGANPPVASRIYAYTAIGLYESVLPGMPGYQSLEGQVHGLNNLPDARSFTRIDYISSANEAIYQIASKIFGNLKPENKKLLDDLHARYYNAAFTREMSETVLNSTDFGKMVATAVLNRAGNDNFTSTRNLSYTVPSTTNNPSFWLPTGPAQVPLEPYWGRVSCFAMLNSEACTVKSIIPFSTAPTSEFYKQAQEVYATSLSLTQDQVNIAQWWSDGSSQTATPPGHWVAIIDQLAERNHYNIAKAAELYVMQNIAMADAFISCWDEKYRLNLLRPVTYLRNYMGHANWQPIISTPPFPEYPSGHSVASGAASSVLTKLLGDVAFTDSANVYLGYPARSYNSFTEAAEEAAISRLYGGIHFREAIENGMQQGREVSKAVFEHIRLRK